MRSIIQYFIKNSIAANILMVAIFIFGALGLKQIKSSSFPEVESKIINIQIVYPGSSPQEIEEGIISKIEENLKGITGVERVTSISSENSGSVTIEIIKGYDMDNKLQDVKNAVDQINSFPALMEPPTIVKRENIQRSISFALGGNVDLMTLKSYGRKVEEEVLALDGISKVELSGFPDEEIEIAFRETDLRAYQLNFAQATQAVQVANLELTGGTIKGKKEELLVRARNKKYYASELRDIVVKTSLNGNVVKLHQVADIRDKWADNPNRSFLNREAAVVVTVSNTLEEDLIQIVEDVRKYIDDFNEKNDVVQASVIRDESTYVGQRINLLTENGVIGFIIVVVLLAMFLNWRLAFWVALSIPISFAGMFMIASTVPITINVISLFGMILVIGILVDDGIVISESIYQQYEKGANRLDAAIDGTMSVLPAVFSAIVTTIIAFAAFFFIEGRMGDFFSQLAVVVIASLLFSLIEGVFILPAHVSHSSALDPDRKKVWLMQKLDDLMSFMRDKIYAPVLRFCMYNKFLTLACMLGLFIITLGAINGGIVKQTFFPNVEFDSFPVVLKMPAGTREDITQKWLDHIEESIWAANEELSEKYYDGKKQAIQKVEKNIGPTSYDGNINIILLDGEERDPLGQREIINKIREKSGIIVGAEQLTYGRSGAFGKAFSISLIGNDYEELNQATERLKLELQTLPQLRDVIDSNQEGIREINIKLKDKAYFLGLNLQEIVGQVRRGFFGSEIQRLQRGRDEVRVWVRYSEKDRSSISNLENMFIRFADGREFPFHEIASLEMGRGVIAINHIDGKREIKVEADVANNDVEVPKVTADIRDVILPDILDQYPTVTALFEGQNRENDKSVGSMKRVFPIAAILMFITIALTFKSIGQTFIVYLLIPFGIIGVAWGHWFMGHPLSMSSYLGVTALIGILVNDALVFITTYNQLIKKGLPQLDAIFDAGTSRFWQSR